MKGTGRGPFESGLVRISRTGRTIFTGASAMGQGLGTCLAQIAASELGVDVSRINVVAGDTAGVSLGLGGFASRQTVTAGSSVKLAAQAVAEKGQEGRRARAGGRRARLELADGAVRVVGAPERNVKLSGDRAHPARRARLRLSQASTRGSKPVSSAPTRRATPTAATSPRSRSMPRPAR